MHIQIFTTETCWACKTVKSLLEWRNIPYEELSAIEYYDEIKQYGNSVPIILVDWEFVEIGNLIDKIDVLESNK